MLKLLYFFNLIDTLGRAQEQIEMPEGVNAVINDGDEIAFFPNTK